MVNHCRSFDSASTSKETLISNEIPDTRSSDRMVIKEEEKEEEEKSLDIRDKIREAFGDDSDSDWGEKKQS